MALTTQQATYNEIQQEKKKWETSFGGKASNCFIEEVKSSELFRFDWGELLSAAPTALSFIGAMWVAASHKDADDIMLGDARPEKGWEHLSVNERPTLRSCLLDVCNYGGREAFCVAGENMEILAATSKRIFHPDTGRIKEVFDRLPRCFESEDEFDEFTRSLDMFSQEADHCVTTATAMRVAFNKWRLMVKELHIASEQKRGNTQTELRKVKTDIQGTEIEEDTLKQSRDDAKIAVDSLKKRVENAEKRLDKANDKVPSPWATVLMGALTSYTQAVPSIVAGLLPVALSAANPALGVGMMASKMMQNMSQPGMMPGMPGMPGMSGMPGMPGMPGFGAAPMQMPMPTPVIADPAVDLAGPLNVLLTTFYEFLGGAGGQPNWAKFEYVENLPPGTPQGVGWLIGNLNSYRSSSSLSNTETSGRIIRSIDKALQVANSVAEAIEYRRDTSQEPIPQDVFRAWQNDVKTARDTVLSINAASNLVGGTAMPNPFTNVKFDIPKPDFSAQNSAISSAMQGVQSAQAALDLAEEKYDAALEKQAKTKAALAGIQKRIEMLRANGTLLENIKEVLRSCISVLIDLTKEISRIEEFFIRLQVFIKEYMMPKVVDFKHHVGNVSRMSQKAGFLKITNITCQTLYMVTLQMKAYFTLLYDIAEMYNEIHRVHIKPGLDMMGDVSRAAIDLNQASASQAKINAFTKESSAAVRKLVEAKQKELLSSLKSRAKEAQKTTERLESQAARVGIETVELRRAIDQGADMVRRDAQNELQYATPMVVGEQQWGYMDQIKVVDAASVEDLAGMY